MDYVGTQRSSVGQRQCRRKMTGLLVRAAPLRFGRPRPSYQCTSNIGPVAAARTALPCPADGPTSRMEMRGAVAVAVAVAVVEAVVQLVAGAGAGAGAGSHLQAVAGRSQYIDYRRRQCKPLADLR
jgi:hypothetical protein